MTSFRSKPKPPATVSASAGTASISVTWPTPPGAGKPVGGFILYRNGVEIASLSAAVRSYTDTGMTANVSASYAVATVSSAGVASSQMVSNAVTVTGSGAAITFDYDMSFESGSATANDADPSRPMTLLNYGNATVETSTTHARAGTRSLRCRLPPIVNTDGTHPWRAELGSERDGFAPINTTMWYAFSIYFPADHVFPFGTDWEVCPFQFKNSWTSSYPHPPSGFESGGNRSGTSLKIGHGYAVTPGATVLEWQALYDLIPYADLLGVWTDFVIQARWSTNWDGIFRVWVNDALKVDRSNVPTWIVDYDPGTTNRVGPFTHIGIYNGWRYNTNWNPASPSPAGILDRMMWADCLRITSDPRATYDLVKPPGLRSGGY